MAVLTESAAVHRLHVFLASRRARRLNLRPPGGAGDAKPGSAARIACQRSKLH
ncbi:hypothetical protein OEW28_16830 [Defluviimonas sp. WL0002]|uniref:Uncharacterized protein n=1 Tax=Albidovulum marisflavi TaxID=2984159 RepID=A0ABT2ZGQ5_9RHOB|nr:hypothetical protein [Defluviimonas sp. WL0002]MCV2870291.1 hypothetical protein [Defluviimonas sp. WL0002]